MKRTLETEIRKIDYLAAKLIEFANIFSFVIREEAGISENINQLILELFPFLIEKKIVTEWPGTTLLSGSANQYKYYFNKDSAQLLSSYNNELYEWIQPQLPEDICLYKDSIPIFVSITHEQEAYFELDENEVYLLNHDGALLLNANEE